MNNSGAILLLYLVVALSFVAPSISMATHSPRIRAGGDPKTRTRWVFNPIASLAGTVPGIEKLGLTRQSSDPSTDLATVVAAIKDAASKLPDRDWLRPLLAHRNLGTSLQTALHLVDTVGKALPLYEAMMARLRQLRHGDEQGQGGIIKVVRRHASPQQTWMTSLHANQEVVASTMEAWLVAHLLREAQATLILATGTSNLKLYGLKQIDQTIQDRQQIVELLVLDGIGVPDLMQTVADSVLLESVEHAYQAVGWHRSRRICENVEGKFRVTGTSEDIRLGFMEELVSHAKNLPAYEFQSTRSWRFFVNWFNEGNNAGMVQAAAGEEDLVEMQLGFALGFLAAKYVPTFKATVDLQSSGDDQRAIGHLTLQDVQWLDVRFGAGATGISFTGAGAIVLWNVTVDVLWG
jgi:hypothetical protein